MQLHHERDGTNNMRKYVKNVIRGIENVRGDTKNVKNVCEKYEKWYKKNIR